MQQDSKIFNKFPRNGSNKFMVYESLSFDNFFRLLLKANFNHEDSLHFMLANCSLSAVVVQERILNKEYRSL